VRILVTGSSGFVAGHVCDALCADGHDVVGIDVKAPREGSPETHIRKDVRDAFFPEGSGFDAAIHMAAFGGVSFAAKHPRQIFESNVDATIQLVDQLRKMPELKRVILASSFSVYGNQCPVTEESPVAPIETYAASKLAQELCFRGAPLPLSVLRFSSVYGRRMRLDDSEATIMAKLVGWISRGDAFEINEDGYQTRDFVHVGDVVDAIRGLLASAAPSGVVHPRQALVNVCTGEAITLRRTIETLSQILGKPAKVEYNGKARPGDMRDCRGGDVSRLRGLLGRSPTTFALGAIEAFAGLA